MVRLVLQISYTSANLQNFSYESLIQSSKTTLLLLQEKVHDIPFDITEHIKGLTEIPKTIVPQS